MVVPFLSAAIILPAYLYNPKCYRVEGDSDNDDGNKHRAGAKDTGEHEALSPLATIGSLATFAPGRVKRSPLKCGTNKINGGGSEAG
jgi:hypothetical protein